MRNPIESPKDPIFWMHHAFVDKLWADLNNVMNNSIQPNNPSETLEPAASPAVTFGSKVSDVIDHLNYCNYTYEELFRMPVISGSNSKVLVA